MNRRYPLISIMLLVLLLVSACSNTSTEEDTMTTESPSTETVSTEESSMTDEATETNMESSEENDMSSDQMTFTIEELAMYNGKDGNSAYVAVDGIVYDVTDVPAWTGGTHNGNMAGQDVTDAIAKAPHGTSTLENLTIVGSLTQDSDTMEEKDESSMMDDAMTFTLETLSAYNGKDGNPAYVAVDGVVYDVTGIPAWTGGTHNGNMAGQDVTDAIDKAPHGRSTLEKLTVVGTLSE